MTNTATGWVESGAQITLGAGGVFTNEGTFVPGGMGVLQTTALTGTFVQSGTPTWLFDIGEIGQSDRLTVSGIAQLGSSVTTVNLHEITTPTQSGHYTLLSAPKGGLLGAQFELGSLDGPMPIGQTFTLVNSDTAQQLSVLPSTGAFVWNGATSNTWSSPFLNGGSNWTRGSADTEFIFGTPGVASDVFFPGTGSRTRLGADFVINSLTITSGGPVLGQAVPGGGVHIGGRPSLTLAARGRAGITLSAGAPNTTIGVPVILGANQRWVNNSAGLLQVNGPTITGDNRNLSVGGPGRTHIGAAIQTGSGSLTKAGEGILSLSGANSYSGATRVEGGTLAAGTTQVFSPNSAFTVGTGAALELAGFDQAIGSLAGAGAVRLGSAVLVTGGNDASTTYGGTISGNGLLVKVGTGTFNLAGANRYTGGTWIEGGTLLGTTTSLVGAILNEAALVFDQSTEGTFGGSVFGSGTLTKQGSGTVTFSGANSHSGATRVVGGILAAGAMRVVGGILAAGAMQVFSPSSAFAVGAGAALELAGFDQAIGSLAGAGAVRLGSAVLVTGGNDASTTYGGVMSGSGGLVKVGTGTFNLAGANSYTGGTWVVGGTLLGTTTSLVGAILNEAALVFDQSTEGTFGGSVFGSGTLTKQGSGTVTFSGANSYSGATRVEGGTLAAGAKQGFSPNSAFTVADGAALELAWFNQAIGSLAGAGAVRLRSALLLTGGNDASTTYGGTMSGSGGLVKVGTGTFNLAGANSYAGATWVAGGTLAAGAAQVFSPNSTFAVADGAALELAGFDQAIGSLAGAGAVRLGSAVLTTGGNDASTTYWGAISGSGGLVKAGSGVLVLTGINTYAGDTTVAAGHLLVTGSIGGQGVRVLRGGVLGGTGLVPTMTLTSGGVLAPGLSIGTLRSSGDVQFDAGSVYQVQTASYGGSDLTVAAGDLLAGGTVEVRAGGRLRYRPINQYTIFTSDAISGLFAGVTSNLAFLNPSLQYDAQNVYLTLRRNDVDFRATGTQGNQTGVAVMLNQLVGTATGALADVVNNVYDLYDGQARQAMTSMSGILHQRVARTSLTSAQTFMGINMTRIGVAAAGQGDESTGLAVNRSSSGRAGVSFAGERRLGWWVSGLGGVTTLQGTAADPGGRAPSAQLAWTRRWCWMASRTAATLAPCRGGSTDGIGRIGHGSTS